ncbi:MAG: glycosyltransferase family 4 protein [Pseudonocardia sp.]|nr:glycosyltransferase family 4 protein [Pseudonocardia sp.]
MTRVHVVLPGDVDDPRSPSGGNTYGRRIARELAGLGWTVARHRVPGSWPRPSAAEEAGLARLLSAVPDGEVVLLDGLVACGVPDAVLPQAGRLRVVVVVHLPLADEVGLPADVAAELDARERATLCGADAIVVTSAAAARRLITRVRSFATPVYIAEPGTDPAPRAVGTDGASALLCVAAVTPVKGHDVLVDALAAVADRPWTCVCAGPLDRAPEYVDDLRARIGRAGLEERVRLVGPLDPEACDAACAAADLAVLASRTETYGMAAAEALARGVPVIGTTGGGLPDTVGHAPDGTAPGLLVPPDDAAELACALRRWFDEPALRARLRTAASARAATLPGWSGTAKGVAAALAPGLVRDGGVVVPRPRRSGDAALPDRASAT